MRKGRIQNSQREPRTAAVTPVGKRVRFLGLSLGGGKADKACLAVLDYYPEHRKLFLTRLIEKIKNEEGASADLKICQLVEEFSEGTESIALDVPWRAPLEFLSQSTASVEASQEPHILWMWKHYEQLNKKKRPKRLFTPYTQRCVEMYVATELEEPFLMNQALGANNAPLLARAAYLQRRFSLPTIEVFPKLALWRVGRSLGLMKSHLRSYRNSVGGAEARRAALQSLTENNVIFLYHQDQKSMVENNHAFESFLCALTGFLKYQEMTESRPPGFPKKEDWIEIPVLEIPWKDF